MAVFDAINMYSILLVAPKLVKLKALEVFIVDKIGELIRKLRKEHNDTQGDLGKKIGYSYGGVAKLERGERKPGIDLLEKIANVYDVPLSYFIGESQNIPDELKKFDVEWLSFINEMEERNLSPQELKEIVEFMEKFKK